MKELQQFAIDVATEALALSWSQCPDPIVVNSAYQRLPPLQSRE
jgi:hypothetical protein